MLDASSRRTWRDKTTPTVTLVPSPNQSQKAEEVETRASLASALSLHGPTHLSAQHIYLPESEFKRSRTNLNWRQKSKKSKTKTGSGVDSIVLPGW